MSFDIGILGGSGQVGTELRRLAASTGLRTSAPSSADVDITDRASVQRWIRDAQPNAIVNCAAFTAVDRAEEERDRAFAVNGVGPGILGACAASLDVPVIHLSTDYVFSGDKSTPYEEDDPPNPMGVYGASKLEGERALRGTTRYVVLRVAWVFSAHGRNFVKAILARAREAGEVRVVGDQFGAPCSARSIAEVVVRLLPTAGHEANRTFHFASQPYASWYEFATKVVEGAVARGALKPSVHVERIKTSEFPTRAKRPANSRLNGGLLLRQHGIAAPSWHRELDIVLDELFSV